MEPLLTTKQVALRLGLSKPRIIQFAKSGRLKGTRLGQQYVFEIADVEAFEKLPRSEGRPKKKKK